LLFGRLQHGGRVVVDVPDGQLVFRYDSADGAAEAAGAPAAAGALPQVVDGDGHDDQQLDGVEDPVSDDTGQ
jgi:hypothetical protein